MANVVQACVADGASRTFYETVAGVTSSLYEPNPQTARDLFEVGSEMEIKSVTELRTVRLDDVAAASGTHFLKLDVQAAERDVLANASQTLHTALAVHTEMEFYPLYNSQPLGWEVWKELDNAGFDLYWFQHLQRYRMKSTYSTGDRRARRLGWGDAVFFPKPERLFEFSTADSLRLCAIWHDVCRAPRSLRMVGPVGDRLGEDDGSGWWFGAGET